MLVLARADLEKLLAPIDVIEALAEAVRAHAAGRRRARGRPRDLRDDVDGAGGRSSADLRPGTHVDAVGAFVPGAREVDTETVRRARVVVDTRAGAAEEAGDVLIPIAEGAITREAIAAELAELVTGGQPGRTRPDEITFFKSVGFALEDLATAALAYRLARARGIGTEVSL